MLVAALDGVAAGGAFLVFAGTLWFWWAMIDEGWLWSGQRQPMTLRL
jgi:hypothetical protein